MKIIVDVMSGDNAPKEILTGAISARHEYGCEVVLVGDSDIMRLIASQNGYPLDSNGVYVEHTTGVIKMEDPPMSIRTKKDSSMVKALNLLADGTGDAVVSAGNTGALYTGASILVSRIKGFRKAAIATILPLASPVLLIDSGANIAVTDENLEQFAIMGSAYMEKVMNVHAPRIGLLNNGVERTKGSQLLQDTYSRLEENRSINFIGNVESRALPYGVCDVIVTDGFSGNLILKYTESICSFVMDRMNEIYSKNLLAKASSLVLKGELESLRKRFCPSEYGGAPLLGISKPVIKAHGSSDAFAIKNAIHQAIKYAKSGMIEHLSGISTDCSESEYE
ncbi:MAG: phosphate acyltransferase PlsX [Clostridia bacterium]|nr:phosphate acyltransferase PlsX [Clostridia bacterium]